MKDQHVHSSYSIDSSEPMENYIKNSKEKVFTFTEHYDYNDPFNNKETVTFDIEKQRQEMNHLEEKYDVSILQGIELGYSRKSANEIHELLEKNTFDIVLLSVHHNDEYDYMMNIPNKTGYELATEYLERIKEALNQEYDVDVLTHLDFGFRNRNLTFDTIKTLEPLIKEVLELAVKNKISLELNTKGILVYNTLEMMDYFVDLYMELGGEDFVVNSDAHTIDHYRNGFDLIKEYLLKKGIKEINYFQKRKKIKINIED